MKRLIALLAVGAAFTAAVPSFGAPVIVTSTVDLLNTSQTSTSLHTISSVAAQLSPAVAIAAGDTLDFTINFAGNESITLNGDRKFFAELQTAAGQAQANANMTGTLYLLGTNYSMTKTGTEGTDHVGEQYVLADINAAGLPSTVTFNGLRWVGTINSYDSGVTSRLYDLPSFSVTASGAAVINGSAAGAVPEPATWGMMVLGFGATGAALRRRKTAVSFG
ncbi:PEPxxWA-CTERM sorting domain-containing protein [Sphingomonas bacterium]|uniref:PEPxxWA-CTERM sorting domain-containing protein n=1 Tax=Sphingomonas bacterium TaxID=1895847 RepID=UPI001575EE5D|nr:PEPxxWA-CTERM sorting domain-containing protein [Sphingomonas bacterium]